MIVMPVKKELRSESLFSAPFLIPSENVRRNVRKCRIRWGRGGVALEAPSSLPTKVSSSMSHDRNKQAQRNNLLQNISDAAGVYAKEEISHHDYGN